MQLYNIPITQKCSGQCFSPQSLRGSLSELSTHWPSINAPLVGLPPLPISFPYILTGLLGRPSQVRFWPPNPCLRVYSLKNPIDTILSGRENKEQDAVDWQHMSSTPLPAKEWSTDRNLLKKQNLSPSPSTSSPAHPSPTSAPDLLNQCLHFNKISRWLVYTSKCKMSCSMVSSIERGEKAGSDILTQLWPPFKQGFWLKSTKRHMPSPFILKLWWT